MNGSEWIHPGYNLYIEDQGRNVLRADGGGGVISVLWHCMSLFILTYCSCICACSIFYICSSSLFSFCSWQSLNWVTDQNGTLLFYFLFYFSRISNNSINFQIYSRRLSTGPILDAEKSSVTVTPPGRKPNTLNVFLYFYCHCHRQAPVPAALWLLAPASILLGRRSWRCGNRTGSIQQLYYGYKMMAATSSGSMMASRRL